MSDNVTPVVEFDGIEQPGLIVIEIDVGQMQIAMAMADETFGATAFQ